MLMHLHDIPMFVRDLRILVFWWREVELEAHAEAPHFHAATMAGTALPAWRLIGSRLYMATVSSQRQQAAAQLGLPANLNNSIRL